MTALVTVETAALLVLAVLVAGLLRAYGSVLRRLDQLGAHDPGTGRDPAPGVPELRTAPGVPGPARPERVEGRDEWSAAHDVAGVGLTGEIVHVRTVGVDHDTVVAFLSFGCAGCVGFWEELARPATWARFGAARLLVVTKGEDQESPAALAALCPPGVDVVMSSRAWEDFAVPGSPFVAVVDGRTGRVKGEGSGASFSQVAALVDQAGADAPTSGVRKPAADRAREHDVDRELLAAGITPGHASLYPAAGRPSAGTR